MTRFSRSPVMLLLLMLAIVPVTSATVVLSDVAFTPNPPLEPGKSLNVVARYAIIPSGSTTFSPGHQLQMQTGLDAAAWEIQVTLDGRNAAYLQKTGRVAFVNGELLSYSTNHDVGMIVTIRGIVPPGAAGSIMALQVDEIDNSGRIVPGSTLTITQPVAGIPEEITPVPTRTAPLVTTPVSPTKAAGFAPVLGILGTGLAIFLLVRPKKIAGNG